LGLILIYQHLFLFCLKILIQTNSHGKVEAPSRVAGEVREIDVLFTPFPEQNTDIESLGLLGKLATTPAIFEPYRNPASKEEVCEIESLLIQKIQELSVEKLEELGEALLDFTSGADLENWLQSVK
jgi:hypothetical protein